MYTRILIAVDDSEPSLLAMKEAIKLAKDQGATLCIVYVAVMFVPAGEGIPTDFKKHEAEKRKQGQSVLKKMLALAHRAKISAKTQLVEVVEAERPIAKVIIIEAEKWKADLIVLGTHGRTGLPRLLLGSVAEEVVRNTTIPIHLVKNPE